MLSAHMRGILLPLRAKVPLCGGVARFARRGGHCSPPPDGLATATPRQNHPRKLCLRGARCGGGHSGVVLFGHMFSCHCYALLVMTRGSKGIITHSLTTPGCAHPSNGGELATYRRGLKFPSAEGCPNGAGWFIPLRRVVRIHATGCGAN